MRPAWRLGIKSLWQRPTRTGLLVAIVALSAALITAVTCALRSADETVAAQVDITVGKADVRIRASGGSKAFDGVVFDQVRALPGVIDAGGKLQDALTLTAERPATDLGRTSN